MLRAIFKAALNRGAKETGVFGLRMQRGSFDFFIRQAGRLHPECTSDLERIEAAFGPTLFIHLNRDSKLDQAISLVKANQSGLWHRAADGTELERLSEPREPVYDADEIANSIAEVSEMRDAWRGWFEKENIQPLQMSYDELSKDPQKAVETVLDALGVDTAIANDVRPRVAKLADATNKEWAERFLKERGLN